MKIIGDIMSQRYCLILFMKVILLMIPASRNSIAECGDHINKDSGILKYPAVGRGPQYPSYIDCSWVFETPGTSIVLKFTSFSIESDHDLVYIRDGKSKMSPLLGQYSGDTLPPILTTSTNKAFIHFTSDGTVSKDGFSLDWFTVDNGISLDIVISY
ncbi:unnamed protein product [Meganyctiphanes norvegica]|uniref:CUB domain-containing protein n=1 Tax=Meganyctiphanes norvegica TaxID=48144 RepID=A0AAV2Q183_MEGNR